MERRNWSTRVYALYRSLAAVSPATVHNRHSFSSVVVVVAVGEDHVRFCVSALRFVVGSVPFSNPLVDFLRSERGYV